MLLTNPFDQTAWVQLISDLQNEVGRFFAQRVLDEFRSEYDVDAIVDAVTGLLAGATLQQAALIVQTSRNIANDATSSNLGLAPEVIERAIQEALAEKASSRSLAISVLNTTAASNAAAYIAAIKSAGQSEITKRWITRQDERVRLAHRHAHLQETGLIQNFTVNGEQLLFPGDTSQGASAKNTIGCRCVVQYIKKDHNEPSGTKNPDN